MITAVTIISTLVWGIIIGIFICLKWIEYKTEKKNIIYEKEIDGIFQEVKKNQNKIKFKQRLQSYCQFKAGKYILVYVIDKKEIAIFKNDSCVAMSNQIKTKTPDQIINFIESNFNKEMYHDIIQMGKYIISSNIIKIGLPNDELKYHKSENIFDLDTILDKINQTGIDSLTNDEKEYLNNLNNDNRKSN